MKQFTFFPTPYPDEMFYSVLCRYHQRSGAPPCTRMSRSMWGKRVSVNILLAQSLGQIAQFIPTQTGLTAHYFAVNNTVYPFLKPLMTEERGQQLLRLLESSQQEIQQAYLSSGLAKSGSPKWQFLRCCEKCWQEDIHKYGEVYWHRLHQLPGILMCPIHSIPTRNTTVFLSDTNVKFHLASPGLITNETVPVYSSDTAEMLTNLAGDAAWLMRHGEKLPSSKIMFALFDQLLCLKGYRRLGGSGMKVAVFHAELLEFYGSDVLAALCVGSNVVAPWSQLVITRTENLLYPMYYLLLMRFLANSAKVFYTCQHETVHPYGEGPWPCRNPVCPHYLQNAIKDLKANLSLSSRHPLTFQCLHCGFTYRHRHPFSKESPLTGKLSIINRGWLWMETFQKLVEDGTPFYRIAEILHCPLNSVKQLAVEQGFLLTDKESPERNYHYSRSSVENSSQDSVEPPVYRHIWLQAMRAHPDASRTFLMRQYPMAYRWLSSNDREWYEAYTPVPARGKSRNWAAKDEETLRKCKAAVEYIRNMPGRPVWINRRSIEKYGGIQLYKNLADGKLPKTQAYLDEVMESNDEWRKKKIQWAVAELINEGKSLYFYQIKIRAAVAPETLKRFADFVNECIIQQMKNEYPT